MYKRQTSCGVKIVAWPWRVLSTTVNAQGCPGLGSAEGYCHGLTFPQKQVLTRAHLNAVCRNITTEHSAWAEGLKVDLILWDHLLTNVLHPMPPGWWLRTSTREHSNGAIMREHSVLIYAIMQLYVHGNSRTFLVVLCLLLNVSKFFFSGCSHVFVRSVWSHTHTHLSLIHI